MPAEVYKYTYTIRWSEEDRAFICTVQEFPSLAAHGNSQINALMELSSVVRTVLHGLGPDEDAPEPGSGGK